KFSEVGTLLASYNLVDPCLDDDELNKFFVERTHVEPIDYEKVCRTVFLPKVRTTVAAPPKAELIAYTRLLQKGPPVMEPIWALDAGRAPKRSNELFMGTAWSPDEDWQKNARYVPQIDFIAADYIDGLPPTEVAGWKKFFSACNVKESGERN